MAVPATRSRTSAFVFTLFHCCISIATVVVQAGNTEAANKTRAAAGKEQKLSGKSDLVASVTSLEADRAFHGHGEHSHSKDHRKGSRGSSRFGAGAGTPFSSGILDEDNDLSDDSVAPIMKASKVSHKTLSTLLTRKRDILTAAYMILTLLGGVLAVAALMHCLANRLLIGERAKASLDPELHERLHVEQAIGTEADAVENGSLTSAASACDGLALPSSAEVNPRLYVNGTCGAEITPDVVGLQVQA